MLSARVLEAGRTLCVLTPGIGYARLRVQCEEEDSEKVVKYERVEPVLARTLQQKLFKSESEATIRRAFEVLDKEKKGFLQPEELSKLLMEEGMVPLTICWPRPSDALRFR